MLAIIFLINSQGENIKAQETNDTPQAENANLECNDFTYQFDNWVLNTATRCLSSAESNVSRLDSAEYNLLLALIEHPRRVLTREQLLYYTKGDDAAVFDRSIDVLISRLRKKIEKNSHKPAIIKTIRGAGYLFDTYISKGVAKIIEAATKRPAKLL